jgi:hypothetical protein
VVRNKERNRKVWQGAGILKLCGVRIGYEEGRCLSVWTRMNTYKIYLRIVHRSKPVDTNKCEGRIREVDENCVLLLHSEQW